MTVNPEFLAEYKLFDKIHESANNLIYRGVNRDSQQPVILKISRSNADFRQQLIDYCHQLAIANQLGIDSIVVPLDLVKSPHHLALIMKDENYISLKKHFADLALSLDEFLPIATAIVAVVDELQQHHTYHQQLNLDHFLFNPQNQQLKLTDFSQAVSFLPRKINSCRHYTNLSPSLRALGKIFYQLLTGIESSDLQAATEIDLKGIPAAIADIICSLLNSTNSSNHIKIQEVRFELNSCWQAYQREGNLTKFHTNREQLDSEPLQAKISAGLVDYSNFYQLLFDSSLQVIFWKDYNSVYLGCNQKFAEIAGLTTPQEIIGKTDYDLPWTKEEADWYRECDRRIMDSDTPEYNIVETQLRADGELTYANTNKAPIHDERGNVIGILGMYQDVTAQKQNEQLLKQQSAAMNVALDGMAILKDGKFIYLNQAHLNIFGYSCPEELLGKSWQILYDSKVIEAMEAEIFAALQRDRFWRGEIRAKKQDGTCFEEELNLILTEDNLLVYVCQDISERKITERKLRLTQFAVQHSADNIFYIDRQGKILATNKSTCEQLNYTHEELCSLSVFDIDASFPTENRELIWAKHWSELRQRKTLVIESRHRTKKGAIFPVEVVANYFQFEGQEYNFARAINISERKQNEAAIAEQLRKTQLLNQITQAIRQSLDTKTIFQTAASEVRQLLKADRVSIIRFDDTQCFAGECVAEDVLPTYSSTIADSTQHHYFVRYHYFTEHKDLNYRQGEVLALTDVDNCDLTSIYLDILKHFQVRAELVLPLLNQTEQLWGLLCIHQCDAPRQWQSSEIDFVREIAVQLCLAIQQAQLLETEREQQQLLKQEIIERQHIENNLEQRIQWELSLTQISQDIRQSLDADTIFETATVKIRQNMNADRVLILQFENHSYCSRKLVAEDVAANYRLATEVGVTYFCVEPDELELYQRGEYSAIADIQNANLSQDNLDILKRLQAQAYLILPLHQKNELWGLLCIYQCVQPRQWQSIEIQFLQKIAIQLDLSLYQAQLLSQAQEQKRIQSEIAEQQKVLTRIIKNIHFSLDIEQIYQSSQTVIFQIRQLFNCDRATLYQFISHVDQQLDRNLLGSNLVQINVSQQVLDNADCEKLLNRDSLFAEQYARYHLAIVQKFQNKGYLAIPILVGTKIWGFIAVIRYTDKKQWKLKEISFLEQVAKQLGIAFQQTELLQQIQQARQNADAANEAKSRFLANMSHELRTPLNAILGFSQLMQRDRQFHERHQETLKIIKDSGEHLLNLINDVLEMSKIEAGKTVLNQVDFDLHNLLNSLEQMLGQRASNKGLQLNLQYDERVPKYIKGDENKLRQVLINLLGNSIKFTDRGTVNLDVSTSLASKPSSHQPNDDRDVAIAIRFEVTDTGVGIAASEIEYLFDPFYQSEAGVKFQQGTGLGLSIVQKFIKLMGGEIKVKSEVGRGTTITFEIQVQQVDTVPLKPEAKQVIAIAPGSIETKILVVEDKWESRKLLVNLLESVGFEVRSAVNGLAGVDLWREWQPHLIWMDIQMPVMDGYQAIAKIREEEAQNSSSVASKTKIVALTASVFQEDRQKILSVGGNEVVNKPFQESVLFEVMVKHLKIDFIYADHSSSTTEVIASRILSEPEITDLLSNTTSQWLAQFRAATIELDDESVLKLIAQLDEPFEQLSQTLETLLHDFQYDTIARCTERAISVNSKQ